MKPNPLSNITTTTADTGPRVSIRVALLLAVNTVLLVGFAVLLLIDYQWSLAARLQEKQTAMAEEAALVLAAVDELEHHGIEFVQAFIDQACAQMQEGISPGHHIAVRINDSILQAQTHHRASPEFAEAMQSAALAPDHRAAVEGRPILVGSQSNELIDVYVSEFTTDIRQAAQVQLLSRTGGIALIGLAVASVVSIVIMRFVTRPIDRLVRTVRGIWHGQLGATPQQFATAELNFLSSEIGKMSRSLAESERHRQQQMDKARRIQENLLPAPDRLESIGIHCVHMPAEVVGGDFFDVKILNDDQLVMCLGDVAGHGVPAAMSASMLKILFEQSLAEKVSPEAVLQKINRRFHAVTLDGDFATMFMAVIDRRCGTLSFASAGHERGYLIRRSGVIEELHSTGMLIGIEPAAECELIQLEIGVGDTLVLLTDGLVETVSPAGQILGRTEIRNVLSNASAQSAHEIATELLKLADNHRGDQLQGDDITLTILKV